MTRKELEQIYYLRGDLRVLEQELERLRCQSLVQSPQPNISHGSGTSDKVGDLVALSDELVQLIEFKREELRQLRIEALLFIYSIPDSLTRQIIYYRCVKMLSWARVARVVGGNNTPDGVRMIYSRFMDKL